MSNIISINKKKIKPELTKMNRIVEEGLSNLNALYEITIGEFFSNYSSSKDIESRVSLFSSILTFMDAYNRNLKWFYDNIKDTTSQIVEDGSVDNIPPEQIVTDMQFNKDLCIKNINQTFETYMDKLKIDDSYNEIIIKELNKYTKDMMYLSNSYQSRLDTILDIINKED